VVLQALLKGMHDTDIRTRVLFRTQNDELSGLTAIVDYIAAEEASSASFSSMSSKNTIAGSKSTYKQQTGQRSTSNDLPIMVMCTHCGTKHRGNSSPSSRKQFCKAYDKKCTKCSKSHHFANVCKSASSVAAITTTTDDDSVTGALMASAAFYATQSVVPTSYDQLRPYVASLMQDGPVTTVPLPHMVHSVHKGWSTQPALPSPTVALEARLDRLAYSSLKLPVPRVSLRPTKSQIRACADTGAQLTTVPLALLSTLGVKPSELLPIATNLNTVTGTPVELLGGLLVEFRGVNLQTGQQCFSRQ